MSESPSQLDRIEDKLDKVIPLVNRHVSDITWIKTIILGLFSSIAALYFKLFGGYNG